MSHCTLIGVLDAKPQVRDELMAMLTAQVSPTRAEPGCMNYDVHVDAQDSCVFMFYENWRSKVDLAAPLKMPHVKPLFCCADELLTRPSEIKFHEMLSAVAR